MSRVTNWLIALTIASGVYVIASDSWNAAYRWNLILHPLLGIAATLILIGYAAKHLRDKLKSQVKVGAGGLAVFLLLPTLGIVFGEGLVSLRALRWVPFAAAVALLFKPVRGMLAFVVGRLRHVPSIVLGSLTLLAWAVALATGAALFPWHGSPVAHDTLILHRVLALVGAALYVTHVLFIQVYRAERREGAAASEAQRDLRYATAAVGAVAAVLVGLVAYEQLSHTTPAPTLLGRNPDGTHPAAPAAPFTGTDRVALGAMRSCALVDCHPTIVDDYEHSNHLRSPRTHHFQRTVELLESERGAHDTLVCAGCHYPLAVATDQPGFRHYEEAPGFTCVSCHAIREVNLDAGPQRSTFVLDPPIAHLRMFVDAAGAEEPSALSLALIRMNPIGHGRALRTRLVGENELCLACHHNEIHASVDPGFERPKCTSCHMQPQPMLDRPGTSHNHLFPGANTAVPAVLADASTVATVQGYLTGEKRLYLDNWGSAWELRPRGESGQHRALWLRTSADLVGEVRPGQSVELRINTTNVGIEHHFPAAPLDLIDVWLEVELRDAAGRTLLASGAIDERGYVDPAAHRLGGYVTDEHGERLRFHRIWATGEEKIERQVANSESIVDRYSVAIPADVAAGELELRARWNYRKLTQEFVEWAYDDTGQPTPRAPVTSIGRIDARWPVVLDPPNAATDAASVPSSTAPAAAAALDTAARRGPVG